MHRRTTVFVLAAAASLFAGTQLNHFPDRLSAAALPPDAAAAALQVPPEAPGELTVLAQTGSRVTFGWSAPLTGPTPTSYVIEGGYLPGGALASIETGTPAPTMTLDVPAGAYYVRVHAIADGLRSVASNEIRIVVNVAEPPSAPERLLGLVNGDSLALSWRNTFAGGAPIRLWLSVSGALQAALPIPLGETFTFAGVPPGTYTLAVIAENDSGVSAPSNAVTLSFPTVCSGAPQAPTRFASWREGSTVFVSWQPPEDGPAVAGYTVSLSGALVATLETTAHSVSGLLGPGEYAVSVSANNACGRGPAVPAAPQWTVVVRDGTSHVVYWSPTPGATAYQVYWSASRDALEVLSPALSHTAADGPPLVLPMSNPNQPLYYRVYPVHGPVYGLAGAIAGSPSFTVLDNSDWPGTVTPALWDINGDGCLDLVGGWGRCDGTFEQYPLASRGLAGLVAPGRENRDSRFADFTGDGVTDIFTNVYSRADDPTSQAILHVGTAGGGFTEDPGVAALHIRGFGETVLAADFDNDGDVDVFVPHYSHRGEGGHNWLLINDGAGHFSDVAEAAGVAINEHFPPEGAQAVDINEDGWVDILVAGHVYVNNGNLTFTDHAPVLQTPVLFDEGLRLFDVDRDGDFDLVHHDSFITRLFKNHGGTFDAGVELDPDPAGSTFGYGLTVCDVNGDGFEDVIVANNDKAAFTGQPRLLLNVGGTLVRSDLETSTPRYNDLLACADLDGSGLPDLVSRWLEPVGFKPDGRPLSAGRFRVYRNRSASGPPLRVRVLGADGARNQQGRIVHIRPVNGPDSTILRAVESGSNLLAQNGYDVLMPAPWPGPYEVSVRFADGWVRTTARAGDALTIRANGVVDSGLQ